MDICDFVVELNKLRKSSSEAIDNVTEFDNFKKYMHIERDTEKDLKDILRRVNKSGKKTLVLLCGSAGDGKSHLMSYLRNSDQEKLIANYEVYNDATEVWSKDANPIETLNIRLDGFSDERLEMPGKNIIIAINLGVLSNFVESPYGESRFQRLKSYVDKCNILTSGRNDIQNSADSSFQHISFADYRLYSLHENGVSTDFIESLLDRIFAQVDENVFYRSYKKKSSECPISAICPVKNNYELFLEKKNRSYIAQLLVKGIIKEKEIITTREIQNYVYDILVSPEFSYNKFCLNVNKGFMLKEYINNVTPSLMFDHNDVTPLMNQLQRYDPVLERSEEADKFAVYYNVSSEIDKIIQQYLKGTSYEKVLTDSSVVEKINLDKVLKLQFFKLLVRMKYILEFHENDEIYTEFLKDLYYYNFGKVKKLNSIYSKVQKAVIQWCGSESDKYICLENSNLGLSIYENIIFKAFLDNLPKISEEIKPQTFIPNIIVEFKNPNKHEIISLSIDYSLYELIHKLNKGYIQTANDRNNHADFISFVEKILKSGSLSKSLLIVSENGERATMEKNEFGYTFKVV